MNINNHTKTGIGLILFGLISNKWLIGFFFSSDGKIEMNLFTNSILCIQFILIILGTYLIIKKPAIRKLSALEILLLLFSIFFSFSMLELGARIWLNKFASAEQQSQYKLYTQINPQNLIWSPHPYLNYFPTPNYSKGLTKHNSLGFRGDEFSVKKPPQEFRIVTIGGSTTYTIKVKDNKKTYPAKLEEILKSNYGYKKIEVINAGVGGYTSWESLINFEFRVLDLNPDLVIIYHGTNDVHARLVNHKSYRGDNSGKIKSWKPPKVSLLDKSDLLRIFRRKLRYSNKNGVRNFVNTKNYLGIKNHSGREIGLKDRFSLLEQNSPIYFKRNISNMILIAQANNIKVLLATWAHSSNSKDYSSDPAYQKGFKEHNKILMSLSQELHIPIFDFANVMSKETKYWGDGRHLNEAGALLKATLFAKYLHKNKLITVLKKRLQ